MSRTAARRTANRLNIDNVSPHFHCRFESNPKPINCTIFPSTTFMATDPAHPFYIPLKRRLAAFDPNRLSWVVKAPITLSKKRTVRTWASKRIREAFILELKSSGFDRHGISLTTPTEPAIAGALCILTRDSAITAPFSEIQLGCKHVLRDLLAMQSRRKSNRQSRLAT